MIYTIAPSGLNGDLIWAGSDTGLIHVTRDGGKSWKDVTPPGLSDWSKISFIEASHFDPAEAYAAIDRHRLDDQRPYLYRTRDYGATWQAITNGIGTSSFLRVVRQDPQDKDLLFAGTELGIYVSFNDGDSWQSLQANLPVTSVPDLVIHGDDLVIATHGRSFWILDDITPLRQAKNATQDAMLYAPATTVRVDNDVFLGTPLPPEEPTAENPPNGAIIDYYLNGAAKEVTLEILDRKGNLVRRFSSSQSKPVKRIPLPIADRWFPAPQKIENTLGMHRFIWDLAWGGSGKTQDQDAGDDDEGFGVPHGPRVAPGNYEVRLSVDGKRTSHPLRVVMDPRSTANAKELDEQVSLGRKIFAESRLARQALAEVQSAQKQLGEIAAKVPETDTALHSAVTKSQDAIKKLLDGAPAGTGDGWGDIMGLQAANSGLGSALEVVESGDRTTPSQGVTMFEEADRAAKLRIDDWKKIKTTLLPQLNDQLKQANEAPVSISEIEIEVEYLMTR